MTTIEELSTLGEEVFELAVLARMMEEYWKASELPSGQDTIAQEKAMSEESLANYRMQYEWIAEKLGDFTGVDVGGNKALTSYFERMAGDEFGVAKLPDPEKGESPRFSEDPFAEYNQLAHIILVGSKGVSFDAFAKEFLWPIENMWSLQSYIALSLGHTAALVNQTYNVARDDIATLAEEAKVALDAIYSRGQASADGGTMLGIFGVATGLLGFVPGLGVAMGVLGVAAGIADLIIGDQEKAKESHPKKVKGGTVAEVDESLRNAIREVEGELGTAEVQLHKLLYQYNDMLADPEILNNVVARDMSFPK